MSALNAKSTRWVKRHPYMTIALFGFALLALMLPVVSFLGVRNQELLKNTPVEDPNFMFLHDGGDALIAGVLFILFGCGLVIVSICLIGSTWLRHEN